MQINILGPKEARSVSKNVLVFILVVICYFMCVSFSIKNDGDKIGNDKDNSVIAPTSSIAPSETSVIKPDSDDNNYTISPSKTVIKPEQKIIAKTIEPSISPSSNEIRPSSISPTTEIGTATIKRTPQSQLAINKDIPKKKTVRKDPSFQLVSSKYMAKKRVAKKDNTKTQPSFILDMVNKKANQSKKILNKSLINIDKRRGGVATQTSINWLTWEEAMRKNAQSPRKIMVELYTDWCTWCVKMDKSTFQDPTIVQYVNENFYAVKFNAETRKDVFFKGQKFSYIQDGNKGYNLFSLYLTRGKLTYPSIVFLDKTVNNPQPIKGFQSVSMMDRVLQFFGEDYYKKMDWSLFNQSFESASR
ncbi:MAG: thioredoxin family protein [Chitinophagales bacterium]